MSENRDFGSYKGSDAKCGMIGVLGILIKVTCFSDTAGRGGLVCHIQKSSKTTALVYQGA